MHDRMPASVPNESAGHSARAQASLHMLQVRVDGLQSVCTESTGPMQVCTQTVPGPQ